METIISIEEGDFDAGQWSGKSGFIVTTSEQVIKLGISNFQSCCESWGYFWCNDNPQDFVGAVVRSVSLTDDALNTKILEMSGGAYRDEGGIMFVNIDTDKGVLQFVAYNGHNGYYGHEAVVECKQLKHSETL